MGSEQDKEALRAAAARFMKRQVGRDEQQRRKQESKARRATQQRHDRTRRDWDEDDEPFEKIRRAEPARPAATAGATDLPRATVAAVHQGRIELDDGTTARIAGELLLDPNFRLCVGDEVAVQATAGPPRIRMLLPRRSWLARPDPGNPHRELLLAANVDIAVIVVAAAESGLRPGLIDRCLLALTRGRVAAAVCVNKVDLLPGGAADAALAATMMPYVTMAVPVFHCSAKLGLGLPALRAHLAGKTCVFVGHSGVGKSALANALDPGGDRRTGAVRAHDGKGRHTTSASSLRRLDDGTRLIDTPGVREFGLGPLTADEVRAGFEEFAPFVANCRFGDCKHVEEPGCAVLEAVASGRLDAARHASYARILASLDP